MSQGEIIRPQDLGLSQDDQRTLMTDEIMCLTQKGNSQAARLRLVELMRERTADITYGASGLDDELEMIREQFRRFAKDKVEPFAHEWHLKDELIPMEIIDEAGRDGCLRFDHPRRARRIWLIESLNGGGFGRVIKRLHRRRFSGNPIRDCR